MYFQLDRNGFVKDAKDIEPLCHDHMCSEFNSVNYINTTQFEILYKKVCQWTGTIPSTDLVLSISDTP